MFMVHVIHILTVFSPELEQPPAKKFVVAGLKSPVKNTPAVQVIMV